MALCTILNTAAASEEELLLPQQERLLSQQELAQVGTTADVVAFREEVVAPHFYYGTCFVVKFQGRQRFRLLECFKHTNGWVGWRWVCGCVQGAWWRNLVTRVFVLLVKRITQPLQVFCCYYGYDKELL